MKLGFKNKILPILLSLSLILNLILIPEIRSEASSYSAETSFTYNYSGYNYQFYYSGASDVPDGYRFDSSALDYLLQKSAEGINISISSGIGAKISGILSSGLSSIFNLYRNFVIATDKLVADWIVWDDVYGFEFQFTGEDSSYPGNETYGSAYGWTFIGWLGEKIDLVLDSQGMLYGSNPIGNYTFSDDQLDLGRWSIHQYEAQGGEFWVPENNSSSIESLKPPYFIGKELHFFVYNNGNEIEYIYPDFSNTLMSYITHNSQFTYVSFCDSKYQSNNANQKLLNGNTLQEVNPAYSRTGDFTYNGIHYEGYNKMYHYGTLAPSYSLSMVAPCYYYTDRDRKAIGTVYGRADYVLNNSIHLNNCALLFLTSLSTSPLPDPIVLPVDDPIPVSNIDPDPVVFDPDPGEDPDPVPGIEYPVDPPLPWPVPPVPPIVSGNDDLWPELNITFDLEDGLIDLANPLVNFEWPSFSSVISSFLDSIVWVSTIMTALYSGTDYNVLFAVLSVFFIAASLLGLYKWWHK